MAEMREGKREGSIISTKTMDSLGIEDKEAWTQLRRELEDVGLSIAIITEHKEFIIGWFREAMAKVASEDAVASMSGEEEIDAICGEEDVDSVSSEEDADSVSNKKGVESDFDEETVDSVCNEKDADSVSDQEDAVSVYHDHNIIQAAKTGDVGFLEKLIAAHVDTSFCDPSSGVNALHIAAQAGLVEIARFLIANGIDIEAKHPTIGATALHIAVARRQVGVVALLLRYMAKPDPRDANGATPLSISVGQGSEEICEMLLKNGADPNFCEVVPTADGVPVFPLLVEEAAPQAKAHMWTISLSHKAVWLGRQKVLKVLLDHGADMSVKDTFGRTALHIAAIAGHTPCVSMLVG
jgi:hypothetical protein